MSAEPRLPRPYEGIVDGIEEVVEEIKLNKWLGETQSRVLLLLLKTLGEGITDEGVARLVHARLSAQNINDAINKASIFKDLKKVNIVIQVEHWILCVKEKAGPPPQSTPAELSVN